MQIPSRDHTDKYFLRAVEVLDYEGRDPIVTAQIFAKRYGILAGTLEALDILNQGAGLLKLEVKCLTDGTNLCPLEPVMHITGRYTDFAHLETPMLGILARRSLVASNMRRLVEAASGKEILFMGARHDDWRVQEGDGYAAYVGGATAVTTKAQAKGFGRPEVGTMPHSLLACYRGDTAAASVAFQRTMGEEVRTIALVDYNNDCVGDSLATAQAMEAEFGKGSLYGVRLDTSERLVDVSSLVHLPGVNPQLVERVRHELDSAGFPDVKIYVSGGFNANKIQWFEDLDLPVHGYGVGSSVLRNEGEDKTGLLHNFDFTMDIVKVNGSDEAKVGRKFIPFPPF